MGNLGQVAGGLLIRLVCTQSPTICFPFLSYTSLRQLFIHFVSKPQLTSAFLCKYVPSLFSLFFTMETLEIFFYILILFLQNLHSGKAAGMYVRVWEGCGNKRERAGNF